MKAKLLKIGLGYREPGKKKMQFKCYWYIAIANRIMISMHNHFDRPFFARPRIIGELGRKDTMFGVGGFQVHYHTFPIIYDDKLTIGDA